MAIKLYYSPQTRALRPRWLLEEIGAPYELVRIDQSKGEQKSADYLKIHPHGVVPTLADGDTKIFESGAICAYLADRFPEKGLAPPIGTPARGLYYQWLIYSVATAEPPLVDYFMNTRILPEAQRSEAIAYRARDRWRAVALVLDMAVAGNGFLVGKQFTAADVMIGSILGWAQMLNLMQGFVSLDHYAKQLNDRPAFKRAASD